MNTEGRKGTRTEWNMRKGSERKGGRGRTLKKLSPEGSGVTEQEAGSSLSEPSSFSVRDGDCGRTHL